MDIVPRLTDTFRHVSLQKTKILNQIFPGTRLEMTAKNEFCTWSKHQEGHLTKLDNMLGQALLFHIIVDITQRTLDGTEIIITHTL